MLSARKTARYAARYVSYYAARSAARFDVMMRCRRLCCVICASGAQRDGAKMRCWHATFFPSDYAMIHATPLDATLFSRLRYTPRAMPCLFATMMRRIRRHATPRFYAICYCLHIFMIRCC